MVWYLADAPDVIAACEAHGTLIRLASIVHVRSGSVRASEDDAGWGWKEPLVLVPRRWPERVARAAAATREIVAEARPWSETLDAGTEAALFVVRPVSRDEGGQVAFPAVLLVALVGAPLFWFCTTLAAVSFLDWRSRASPNGMLGVLGSLAALGLFGGLLSLAAGGLARVQRGRAATRVLGAPLRPGEAAALPRTLARVGVLAAVLYVWGPMMAFALGGPLIAPGRAVDVTGGILSLLLFCSVIAGVAQWRHARST